MIQVGGPYTPETLNEGKVNLGNPNNPVNATYSGGGSGTVSDFIWTRNSGRIYPFTITDRVSLGTTSYVGSERLRVLGETNTDILRTANAYIDTARIRSGSYYANITTSLTATRNLTLPNASGTLALTSDIPLFANAALLATYTNTNSAITNTISYAHQHSNYSTLNSITPTYVSNWNTAYSWGNHAGLYASISHNHTGTYQPLDADLTSIAGLSGTSGLLRKTGANTWTLDTAIYLTSYTETDPIFTASTAYGIDGTDITHWDLAYTNNHTHTNKTLLDILTSAGAGTQFLANDGTYKSISTTVAGSDTEIQFNDGGTSFGGDSTYTFNKTTKLVTSYDNLISNNLYIGDTSTYINNASGDLSFTDINAGTVTLSTLLTGATNYWTAITGGIYYGTGSDKVGINTSAPNEALTIVGNIEATQFNTKYYRYNGNWLIGTNVGTSLLRTNVIAFDNIDSATPLTLMDLSTRQIEFDGDVILSSTKNLTVGNKTTTQYLQLNAPPTTPAHSTGLMYWDSVLGVPNVMSNITGCIQQVGLETWVRVYNSTGSTIPAGTPVYVVSASGDLINIAPARANSESTSLVTIGLTTNDIATGTQGFVTIVGIVHDINTSTLTEGGYVYVSPSVAGGLTSTRPVAPNVAAAIGICTVRDASVGSIFVNLRVQPTVERLSNVYVTGIVDNDVLSWDAANNRWKNRPVTATPPSDGILDWDVTNNRYQPYSTQQANLSFDTSSTTPSLTTRLNINSNLYATNLYTATDIYLPSTGNVYLGSPTVDGSWRIVINGTGLEFQRRESSTWVMKGTIEA